MEKPVAVEDFHSVIDAWNSVNERMESLRIKKDCVCEEWLRKSQVGGFGAESGSQ